MSQHAAWIPGKVADVVRSLVNGQPDFVDVTTPSNAGDELAITHGLGRIPKGYFVANRDYAALNHGKGGTDWTKELIYLKFSTTDKALTIAVF